MRIEIFKSKINKIKLAVKADNPFGEPYTILLTTITKKQFEDLLNLIEEEKENFKVEKDSKVENPTLFDITEVYNEGFLSLITKIKT